MATARPFAYNPGLEPIPGTTQVGNLVVGTPTSGFTSNPQFWNGPDEDIQYVIGYDVPSGDQPNPLDIPAFVQFYGCPKTDADFINLSEFLSRKYGTPQTFANVNEANTWLGTNGFFSSFEEVPITPTPTATVTSTNTPTITPSSNIVLNNLILYYNPEFISSYPGTGATVFDLSSPQYNGQLVNSPTHSFDGGGYFDLNGTNQYISIPHNSALKPTTAISMEQWLLPDNWTGGGWPTGYWTSLSNTQGGGYAHYLGANQFISYVRANGSYQVVSGNTSSFSGWHHFVTTFDGRFTKLYIDGVLIDTKDIGTSGNPIQYAVNNSLFIGAEAGSGTSPDGNYWDGKTSITRIYNTALSDAQVIQNYNFNLNQYQTPTPTPTTTPTVTQTPTGTLSQTPTPTPSTTPPCNNFFVTVSEVGSDVVWSGSGCFNLTDLTFTQNAAVGGGYDENSALFAVDSIPGQNTDWYSGGTFTTFPSSFGPTGPSATPNSHTGDSFGVIPGAGGSRTLIVPTGYVSGTQVSGSMTFQNTTITAMSLTSGTYVYSWGTGANTSTLTLQIG